MVTAAKVGDVVRILRVLSGELARDRHPLAHVPQQLASALLDEPVEGCQLCGGELPPPARTGRPRVRCLRCSPPRRKPS